VYFSATLRAAATRFEIAQRGHLHVRTHIHVMAFHGLHGVRAAVVAHPRHVVHFRCAHVGRVALGILWLAPKRRHRKRRERGSGQNCFAHMNPHNVLTLNQTGGFCNKREVTAGYGSNSKKGRRSSGIDSLRHYFTQSKREQGSICRLTSGTDAIGYSDSTVSVAG
jgi:hypothetical protein